jgi:hypothetical protein
MKATEGTYGVVIFQEQMLAISREYGKLSWKDTGELRKAASKTLGDEFFGQYKERFIKGALESGDSLEAAEKVWNGINTMGSWAFNKSHAVSYGLVTYLCAYMKANHFLEFAVASLNHSKDDSSAFKLLRDMHENDNVQYVPLDADISVQGWSVHNGSLYGGLLTVDGIGPVKANKIVKSRVDGSTLPAGIIKSISLCKTPFKYLYPAKELYGDYYTDPESHGLAGVVTYIKDANCDGTFTIIGKMIKKNLRDSNEPCFVAKRDGKYLTGPTSWLNITLEDDTDSIMCKIKVDDYEQFGREISESGKEDVDWYMVNGKKINGWGIIFVSNIRRITRNA